ncbi:hypothetical protein Btru_077358 [Bulinus truncatus]|nr:hypothetical protein Btru_077358 [Bulinus truncatus]
MYSLLPHTGDGLISECTLQRKKNWLIQAMHLSICVLLIIFQSSFITGAVLKFDKKTPTESNNYTCAVITCWHALELDDLNVEEISLFDIVGPSRLVSVKEDNCKHAEIDDVILVSKAFSKTGASVALGVRNASICSGGEFMCEVTYVNGRLDQVTDAQVVRPNTLTRDDMCRKLGEMTSSIETLRNQLGITTENHCAHHRQARGEWQLAFRGTAGAGMPVYTA